MKQTGKYPMSRRWFSTEPVEDLWFWGDKEKEPLVASGWAEWIVFCKVMSGTL